MIISIEVNVFLLSLSVGKMFTVSKCLGFKDEINSNIGISHSGDKIKYLR